LHTSEVPVFSRFLSDPSPTPKAREHDAGRSICLSPESSLHMPNASPAFHSEMRIRMRLCGTYEDLIMGDHPGSIHAPEE